jgi:hypothetical protein
VVPTYGIEVLLLPVSIPVDLVPANSIEPSQWDITHHLFFISSAHIFGSGKNMIYGLKKIYRKEDQANIFGLESSLRKES